MSDKVEDPRLQCNDGDKEGSFHSYQGDNSTMTKEYTEDMSMCATFPLGITLVALAEESLTQVVAPSYPLLEWMAK